MEPIILHSPHTTMTLGFWPPETGDHTFLLFQPRSAAALGPWYNTLWK